MLEPVTKPIRIIVLAGVAALALAGCATTPATTGSIGNTDLSAMSPQQAESRLQLLARRYKANPRDKTTMLYYAEALRRAGQPEQAVAVLEAGITVYPSDNQVRIGFARALTAAGRFQQALNVVNDAIVPQSPDWDALLVKGAILDQMGQNGEARKVYQQALTIAPNQPAIEGNIGLSYAMSNDLRSAEAHLRKAAAMPGATSRIRQNLALIVGLQGRFDESRKLFAAELAPAQVEANMAYVKGLLTQQNRWQAIRQAG
jgi:Flp pilus assembly protein TadD